MRAWIRRVLAAGCAGAVTLAGLAGCGSAGTAHDVITPAQAKQVALAWLHANDATQVAEEAGSLQRIDQAFNALQTPGPASTPPRQIRDDTIWVAHQSAYPISFLCFDVPLMGGQPSPGQLFRFTKASQSAPWTVTHQDLLLSLGSRPPVALDSAGYAQVIPATDYGRFLVSPARLAADWAAYLNAGHLSDGHEFAPGPFTTGDIENNKKQIDAAAAQHDRLTLSFTVGADPVDAYLERDGSALVLVALTVTSHHLAETGAIKVTQNGKGISGPVPGSYRDITNVTLVLAAFTVPPKGSAVKVSALGAYYGPVATTATRA